MRLKEQFEELRKDPEFIYETLKFDLSEQLIRLMKEKGINKKELARRMGVSPAYVTKIFSADNISLKTLAKVLSALELENYSLLIMPEEEVIKAQNCWYERSTEVSFRVITPEVVNDEAETFGLAA